MEEKDPNANVLNFILIKKADVNSCHSGTLLYINTVAEI